MKQCRRCLAEKPESEFFAARGNRDGLQTWCKACKKEHWLAWYAEHKDAYMARCAEWARRNPEKCRAMKRRYYRAHPEQGRKECAKFRLRHPEYIRRKKQEWAKAHPESGQAKLLRRRARIAGAEINDLTPWMVKRLPALFRNKCAYCGRELKLEVDHVVPVRKGGNHTLGNVAPACRRCNVRKSDKPAPEFWWKRASRI